jgi:serine/threonine-protein kinase
MQTIIRSTVLQLHLRAWYASRILRDRIDDVEGWEMADQISIELTRGSWKVDLSSPLSGKGGFGQVFRGNDAENRPVAVKRLDSIDPALAHREIAIVDSFVGRKFEHVLEFLDCGYDAGTGQYYIVMEVAAHDLRSFMAQRKILTEQEAAGILLDVVKGLAEVADVVHRDLKPNNVLFHEGRWKIADFGISRFVEATTSLQTMKASRTPPYAAPEQWREERATHATDVYALGVMAYEMLAGVLPFEGPAAEDFRNQHLHSIAPRLQGTSPRFASLIDLMLMKAPDARPDIPRLTQMLNGISSSSMADQAPSPGLKALAEAGSEETAKLAMAAATREQESSAREDRSHLASSALELHSRILGEFFNQMRAQVPAARFAPPHFEVSLGSAQLLCERLQPTVIPPDAFPRSGWDVITGAYIIVKQSAPNPYEWSASLWYSDLGKRSGYRWWEVTYMVFTQTSRAFQPFHLSDFAEADSAAGPGIGRYQLAAKPKAIDDDGLQAFCDRWATLLAKANKGELTRPTRLPID